MGILIWKAADDVGSISNSGKIAATQKDSGSVQSVRCANWREDSFESWSNRYKPLFSGYLSEILIMNWRNISQN